MTPRPMTQGPSHDAGKRELPAQLRNRFTELWVPEPSAHSDLAMLVGSYLAGVWQL